MNIKRRRIVADIEFESVEDAISAFMDDPKQKSLYDFMLTLHKDDMVIWLEGVLDCAEAFGVDCEGLQYLHDEMIELGEETALKMIKDVSKSIHSAIDMSDKPYVVVTRFIEDGAEDGDRSTSYDYEEIIYAFNKRTARAIADSVYKDDKHEIISVDIASDEDLSRLANRIRR